MTPVRAWEKATAKPPVSAGATEVGADHAEWQAERLVRAGLGHFALSDRELRSVRKSDARKVVIARLIKAQTAVSLRWISTRLRMGAQSHVSRLSSPIHTFRAQHNEANHVKSKDMTPVRGADPRPRRPRRPAADPRPRRLILFRAEGPRVALVEHGKIALRSIVLGRDLGSAVEVSSGVSATDKIVLNPSDALTEGAAVEATEAK